MTTPFYILPAAYEVPISPPPGQHLSNFLLIAILVSVKGESHCGVLCTYLFLAVLGLRCCLGSSLVATCRLLTAVASPVVEHGFSGFSGCIM